MLTNGFNVSIKTNVFYCRVNVHLKNHTSLTVNRKITKLFGGPKRGP